MGTNPVLVRLQSGARGKTSIAHAIVEKFLGAMLNYIGAIPPFGRAPTVSYCPFVRVRMWSSRRPDRSLAKIHRTLAAPFGVDLAWARRCRRARRTSRGRFTAQLGADIYILDILYGHGARPARTACHQGIWTASSSTPYSFSTPSSSFISTSSTAPARCTSTPHSAAHLYARTHPTIGVAMKNQKDDSTQWSRSCVSSERTALRSCSPHAIARHDSTRNQDGLSRRRQGAKKPI